MQRDLVLVPVDVVIPVGGCAHSVGGRRRPGRGCERVMQTAMGDTQEDKNVVMVVFTPNSNALALIHRTKHFISLLLRAPAISFHGHSFRRGLLSISVT